MIIDIFTTLILFKTVYSVLDSDIPGHEHVKESTVLSAYTSSEFKSIAEMKNFRIEDEKILLRSKEGEGSIINIKKENTMKEWSAELKINKLDLTEGQKALISFWYTRDPVKKGSFLGGEIKYSGFIAGIEFKYNNTELLIHYNVGLNFKESDSAVLRDEINPNLLKNVDELIIKVIHTSKNFVIELYNKDKLIFDTLRISGEVFPIDKHGKMHFGITTAYTNIPVAKAISMFSIAIYERKENEKYDPEEHFTEHNNFPRNESNEEIKHAIANLDHFMAYIHMVLGDGEENYILDMKKRLEDFLKKQSNEIEKTNLVLKDLEGKINGKSDVINENKIKTLEERIDKINESIFKLNDLLNKIPIRNTMSTKEITKMVIAFAVLISGLLVIKNLLLKFMIIKLSSKKE